MGAVKQIDIKNRTFYFYNHIIDLENFKSTLLEIDKKNPIKKLAFTILDRLQLKKIDDCENIYSVNPLYLLINHANRYIEEKGMNKYLIFDSTDENKELLKKYNDVFDGISSKIKAVSNDEYDYEKDYMIQIIQMMLMTITIRCAFEGNGKLYLKVFLDDMN